MITSMSKPAIGSKLKREFEKEPSKLNCMLKTSIEWNETLFPVYCAAPRGIHALFIFPFTGGLREEEITLSLVSELL